MTVIVEVVHAVKPITNTTFDRWVEWYGNDIIPAMTRNGFDVLGAFKRSTGPLGEDVLVVRFDSMAAYEQAGVSLRNDTAFLKAVSGMTFGSVKESVKIAAPVPYATEQRLEKVLAERPDKPRPYMQAVLQVKTGGQPVAYEAIGKLAGAFEASGRIQLATAYETTVGQRGEVTDLWALSGGMPDFSYRAGDPLAEVMTSLRAVAPEESISILNPLPYSRMQ